MASSFASDLTALFQARGMSRSLKRERPQTALSVLLMSPIAVVAKYVSWIYLLSELFAKSRKVAKRER